jgi:hypothetical protein
MKKIYLLAIISLASLVFGACATTETTRNNTTKTTTMENNSEKPDSTNTETTPAANNTETKNDEPPKSDLKPSDVTDEPIPAEELNAAFMSDEGAWKGKEVSVVGKYHSTTTSQLKDGDQIRVDIADNKGKKSISCIVKEKVPEEVVKERNGRVFKGTIKAKVFDRVELEPCEIVK